MKLVSCHIENFGRLSNQKYDFTEGINLFCQDNGTGKSTLAVFIKAMLFGLQKTRIQDLDVNEREKYNPWQGGSYGGYLDFFANGKTYRVERSFGKKESDDSVRLIDMATRMDTQDFDKDNLGVELFGIDQAGYEKSAYYSQRTNNLNSDKIETKLTQLLEEDNDMGNFSQANNVLNEAKKIYNKKQGNDIITQTELKITDALNSVANAERCEERLEETMSQKQQQTAVLEKLTTEHIKVAHDRDVAIKRTAYNNYLACKQGFENALQIKTQKEATFLGNTPTQEELDALAAKISALTMAHSNADTIGRDINDAETRQQLIAEGKTQNLEQLNELKGVFYDAPPTEEEIKKATRNYEKSNELAGKLSAQAPTYKIDIKHILLKRKTPLIAIGVGLIILLAGIISEFFSPVAGTVLSSLGSVVIGGGGIAILLEAYKDKKAYLKSYSNNIKSLTEEQKTIIKEMTDFFDKYKMPSDNPIASLMKVKELSDDYRRLSDACAKEAEEVSTQLQTLYAEQKKIAKTIDEYTQDVTKYLVERGEATGNLENGYKQLRTRYNDYEKHNALATEAKKRLDGCAKPQDDDLQAGDESYDMDALIAQEKQLSQEIDSIKAQLKNTEDDITRYTEIASLRQDYQSVADNLTEQLKKHKSNLKIIEKTSEYLTTAKYNLTHKYLGTIEKAFKKYLAIVLGKTPEIAVKADLEYEVEERGKKRDPKSFSRGYRDLFDICAQLALADTLFDAEKPFLILDDPFKNLDDGKMEAAKNLIAALAKEYQVIYFVCHSSRI